MIGREDEYRVLEKTPLGKPVDQLADQKSAYAIP